MATRRKLPDDVWYTPAKGGIYISWNGRADGAIYTTSDRGIAHGEQVDDEGIGWRHTGMEGADGGCSQRRITRLVVEDWA